jgi:endonuclease/exonuclease/phosphatase family metal-dependent hydrolase
MARIAELPMVQVSVLTLNINAGFDVSRRRFLLPALREAMRQVGADVVLLQEVLGAHAGHARRHAQWAPQPQHAYLADAHWPHHAYGRNAVFVEGHQGNAILSRMPIVRSENHDVSIAGHEPRGLLHAVLELPDASKAVSAMHVVNVHLGLSESHRREQVAALCRLVETDIPAGSPLVVAGDFNDWRQRGHDALRAAGLHEAFEQTGGHLAKTFPSALPLLPLDRIYLRNADVQSACRLSAKPWSRLSDHVALLARLRA